MNLVLFVEGDTERKALGPFIKRWLDPRLRQPVGVRVVASRGWAPYVSEIARKVALHLSGRTGVQTVGAVGLLDLYGPDVYPESRHTAHGTRALRVGEEVGRRPSG